MLKANKEHGIFTPNTFFLARYNIDNLMRYTNTLRAFNSIESQRTNWYDTHTHLTQKWDLNSQFVWTFGPKFAKSAPISMADFFSFFFWKTKIQNKEKKTSSKLFNKLTTTSSE